MKIEIFNLGVVEKAEINLKPLTVFIGPNNTGKTWTSYTLALILGFYGFSRYLKAYVRGQVKQDYPPIDNAVEQILEGGNAQINLVEFANEYAEIYINDVACLAPNWMPEFMATERVSFKNLKINFSLAETKDKFLDKLKSASVERKVSPIPQSKDALLSALKEMNEEIVYFYTVTGGKILEKLPRKVIKEFVVQVIFSTLHRNFYSSYTYLFPTERTTFITFPFSQEKIYSEKAMEEIERIDLKGKGVHLMAPVQSLLETILVSSLRNFSEREKEIRDNPKILVYVELAKFLESNILQGNVDFDISGLQKELLFKPSELVKLQMQTVSSMVKELAPLVLCLRYLVEPDEWLIIDEPEMNLHPAAQVEIIEFLVMLVQAGLNVLITTHSPYIIDHLVNLIQAAKQEDKESIKDRFYLERTDAFISQERVSVYLFENGTARNILDEEGQIDWGTFGNVSDDISRIFT